MPDHQTSKAKEKEASTYNCQPNDRYLPNRTPTAHSANMPSGAATRITAQGTWDETRATRPSSHHSSRTSTRSAAPENMQVALRAPSERSSRHDAPSSYRESRHGSQSSHRSSSHHPSHYDSRTHEGSSKSTMSLVRDKTSGQTSLLKRATTTAASRRDAPTREYVEPSYRSSTRDTRDSTRESSRHPSTRDHASRTSGTLQTRARSQSHTTRPMGPGLETRLERIEEGMQKMKVAERPATSTTNVVIVQQRPEVRYGSSASFCAGYNAARRDLRDS